MKKIEQLKLKKIEAYTVHSSDDEYHSSNKGVYKDFGAAMKKAPHSGWYGSNGDVKVLDDIWQDEEGELYSVKPLGKFSDEEEKHRVSIINSIKSKLAEEELKYLNL